MIRDIVREDVESLKNVLDNCDLFPSEYLDDMISGHLSDPASSDEIWFTYEEDDKILYIAYCAPMQLTNGTYNLYAIGIHRDHQHRGVGTKMMEHVEERLMNVGARVLIVETSSAESQANARSFYLKCGYTHEATLRDFWDEGDDKVVYWKKINVMK